MPPFIYNPAGKPPAALDPDVDALANFLSGQGMGPEDYQAPGVGDIKQSPPDVRAVAYNSPYETMMRNRADAATAQDRERANAAVELSNYFSDLQGQKRAADLQNEIAKSTAVPALQGANQQALEKMKEEALTNRIQQTMNLANQGGGDTGAGGAGGGQKLELEGMNAEGIPTFKVDKAPQLIQTQQANATHGLEQIPGLRMMADNANQRGLIGPTMGPLMGQASGGSFPGNLLSYFTHPEDLRAFNNLKGGLQNIITSIASTVGSGRAASSPAILARFNALLNPNQSPDALRGGIDAAERWLTTYANAKNSAEMDAADASVGVTPGPYAASSPGSLQKGADLGANWGGQ